MRRLSLLGLLIICSTAAPAQEIRAFWADGFSAAFKTPEQVDTLLARLRKANCNAIFAQMRKGGDAYYLSRYDPWAADNPQHLDALADLIRKAHQGTPRIAVHAWLNTCAVGRSHDNPHHIAKAHPEYLSLSDTGADYDDEATKIDPGNPDAADWTFRVYLDVARHYPDIDGVHFDFVRYGGAKWGYNPVSVARFNARLGRTGQPKFDDRVWKQWRRDQVTSLVRKVYAMVQAVNPRVAVSAATITWGDGPTNLAYWNEKSAPMNRVFQDWRSWMREGILDLNCLMSYYQEAKHPDMFRHWIDWAKDNQYRRWAVPSSGCWFNSIPNTFKQIDAIRAPSKRGNKPKGGVLLYCYNGTNLDAAGKEQTQNDAFFEALSEPSSYSPTPPYAAPSAYPALPWKAAPKTGHLEGFVLNANGLLPVDGALVSVGGRARRTVRTDGTGFYAFVDLPPGKCRVGVHAPGYTRTGGEAEVTVGSAATCNVMVGEPTVAWSDDMTGEDWQKAQNGTPVWLQSVRVVGGTDTFAGNLFVRTKGGSVLRVQLAQPPVLALQPGDLVAIEGAVAIDDGERCVGGAVARLVGMTRWEEQPAEVRYTDLRDRPEATDGVVEIEGRVAEVRPDRFVLEGGGSVEVMLGGRKDPGVEAAETPPTAPLVGQRLRVRGVVTVSKQAGGKVLIRLRPRTASDVTELPQTAYKLVGGAAIVVAACFRQLLDAA